MNLYYIGTGVVLLSIFGVICQNFCILILYICIYTIDNKIEFLIRPKGKKWTERSQFLDEPASLELVMTVTWQ